jgi:hypothetical protein
MPPAPSDDYSAEPPETTCARPRTTRSAPSRRSHPPHWRRSPRLTHPATLWSYSTDTTPPAGWLLHAIVTIITGYTRPGDRILLLASPLITHHPPTGMASTPRQSLTNPVIGLHDAARTVARLLLEALRAGRHAIGPTTHRRYGELTRANLTTAHHADARPEGRVLDDTPTNQDHLTGLTGKVDLILTTPRHHASSLVHTRPPNPDPLGTLTKALVRCRPLPTLMPTWVGTTARLAGRPRDTRALTTTTIGSPSALVTPSIRWVVPGLPVAYPRVPITTPTDARQAAIAGLITGPPADQLFRTVVHKAAADLLIHTLTHP